MALSPLIMAGGFAKAYNDDVEEKKAQVAEINAFKRKWLFETGMQNIQNRRAQRAEAAGRVTAAKQRGFSDKVAMALEKTGQLANVLEETKDATKIPPKYIEALSATVTKQLEKDQDLAEAVKKGLMSGSYTNDSEMAMGLIDSMGDLDKLQEQYLKTIPAGGGVPVRSIKYTNKGAVSLADRKSIATQLAGSLNTMYANSFTVDSFGNVTFTRNAKPEVQVLFNNLTKKAIDLAEDPSNSFSPVSAVNTLVGAIEGSQGVQPTIVLEKIDEALTTPEFTWEPFKTQPGDGGNAGNNNPIND